jgi:hypothetical protein
MVLCLWQPRKIIHTVFLRLPIQCSCCNFRCSPTSLSKLKKEKNPTIYNENMKAHVGFFQKQLNPQNTYLSILNRGEHC